MFAKPKFQIPSLREVAPDLQAKIDLKDRIVAEVQILATEDFELARAPPEADLVEMDPTVAELLGRDPDPVKPGTTRRRQEIFNRRRDLDRAAELLWTEIRQGMNAASAVVRGKAMPEYRRRVSRFANAMIELEAAALDCNALRNDLVDAGYSANGLDAHGYNWAETGGHSTIAAALRELVRDGWVDRSAVPERLR
jgi:hypothetical protein